MPRRPFAGNLTDGMAGLIIIDMLKMYAGTRNFFTNYAAGMVPHKCGSAEKHIGGLVGKIPAVAYYARQPENARENALAHLVLTHPGKKMEIASS